jgi:tryptophanyl-tRNA synthetase
MSKKVILTGLRANNDLHIGNYFGALLPIIDMAKRKAGEYQINLFVPDLHSFTTPINHSQLQAGIRNTMRLFVAAGLPLDNSDIHLYRQSYVPAHSELTVILNCFTGMGEMERMTQYKDKSGKLGEDRVSLGLFDYPVLMAADMLLYGATYVPVGDDQSQHIEITRDLGERMNAKFGELFTVPKSVKEQHAFFGKDQGLRIKDLQDPTKKMSKSDETGKGIIFLSDDPKAAAKKVMSAATDDVAKIQHEPQNQPGISNLLQILALLEGKELEEVVDRYAGQTQYGEFKKDVAAAIEAFLTEFQANLTKVDDTTLDAKLAASEKQMNEIANATLLRVQTAVGLR